MEKTIRYYSTNLQSPEVNFSQAILKGLAPDGGLYMPTHIPKLTGEEIDNFRNISEYKDIAFTILNKFLSEEIDENLLAELCADAYNFPVPIEKITANSHVLRLDQGPTASFKDFAARMMGRLMNHFIKRDKKHYTILTATSGDTGSAVANAFHGLDGIDVIILFPAGEVTDMQRKQMTTLTENIKIIAINGKFDDCQKLVKQAFTDNSLLSRSLTSANSINIGRLLPQSVYYFYAWSRLASTDQKATFSVPSGNYGDLMGGIIAKEMGLPVERFIISANANNEVPEYLKTGNYAPIVPSINCISSAMNVGHPSNLARIIALYGGVMDEKGNISKKPDLEKLRKDFYAVSVSDEATEETIVTAYKKYGIVLEPHGAVAWNGLSGYPEQPLNDENKLCISLETAHPFKFKEEIIKLLGFTPQIPASLKNIEDKAEHFVVLPNSYAKLKDFILKQ